LFIARLASKYSVRLEESPVPKLSVIVACYNVQDYLFDTLRGLARNAGPATEFILVNDASADATGDILERGAETLPQARVIHHERNQGLAAVRNTGIDVAQGEYLTFLDGDDWYAPGFLDDWTAAIDELGVDFLRADHVRVTGRSRSVVRAPAPRRGVPLDPRDGILPASKKTMVDYPNAWSVICHRRVFDEYGVRFEPQLRTCEDRPFTWQLHLRAKSYASVGLHGICYRRGVATSLTQIGDDRQLDFMPAHDLILAEVLAHEEADRFLPKIVRTYCAMIAYHLNNAGRLLPEVARRQRQMATEALRRMPQDTLERTLDEMDAERSRMLRRLLGRAPRKAAA
jgi:hypothetical protein